MKTHLLPVRPRPLDEELFSSWLFRLAEANGTSFHQLICSAGLEKLIHTTYSFDRACDALLAGFSELMGLPVERLSQSCPTKYGVAIGPYACCSECLSEHPTPHHKVFWRLAFYTVCEKHNALLIEHCPCCDGRIDLLALRSETRLQENLSLATCPRCMYDLREASALQCASDQVEAVLLFQKLMMSLDRTRDGFWSGIAWDSLLQAILNDVGVPYVREISLVSEDLSREFERFYGERHSTLTPSLRQRHIFSIGAASAVAKLPRDQRLRAVSGIIRKWGRRLNPPPYPYR